MKIKVFTLFPEMLRPMLEGSILGRAIRAGLLSVELINPRDYTEDIHRKTDDYPFGGGAGMVMYAQPIVDAFRANAGEGFSGRRIYLSPRGRTFTQRIAEELAREDELALLCGHYEGVDQRALDSVIDEELSIGDYVLTGGELGALVVIDAVSRLIPGVLGSAESGEDESFTTGLLEYPQYTRPADFRGDRVPEVLLGGNHADILAWRREKQLEITLHSRPELLDTAPLDENDRDILRKLRFADALKTETGIPMERLEQRLAKAFPKEWIAAFIPEEHRQAARKQCVSGRRHIGYLKQAHAMGFVAPAAVGKDALTAWKCLSGACTLYLQHEGLLLALPDAGQAPEISVSGQDIVLTDTAMRHTLVIPAKGEAFYIEIPDTGK